MTTLQSLVGKQVLLMCANYFYTGKLKSATKDEIVLENPSIVYETGPWSSTGYADSQPLHTKTWTVSRSAVESFGPGK